MKAYKKNVQFNWPSFYPTAIHLHPSVWFFWFYHDSFLQSSSPLARTDYTVHRAVEIIDSEGHVLICTYFDITYTSVICIMIPCSYFGLDFIRGAVHVFAANRTSHWTVTDAFVGQIIYTVISPSRHTTSTDREWIINAIHTQTEDGRFSFVFCFFIIIILCYVTRDHKLPGSYSCHWRYSKYIQVLR